MISQQKRNFIEKLLLVAVASGLPTFLVLHQKKEQSKSSVLRIERLEIVDENGAPCVVLSSGNLGGTIQVLSPSKGEGTEGTLCYIGSPFPDMVQLSLKAPKPGAPLEKSESMINLSISDQFSTPRIGVNDSAGTPRLRFVGSHHQGPPVLELWQYGQKDPVFSK